MAISLASLQSPQQNRPLIMTIVADGGMGKTTLASLFPSPVFIRTEDGTQSIKDRKDVALFPVAQSIQDVMDCIAVLQSDSHKFRTVVVDSITRFNSMVEAFILAQDPKAKGLNQAHGGYGNAYDAVAKIHSAFRDACSYLSITKKMNVVYIAHASTETIDPPDGEPFTRYSIPVHKKSLPVYTNDVDVVAYIKMKTYTTGDGNTKKALTDGSRIITCYPTPSHISKNRLGIKDDLVFVENQNPFESYLVKE